MGERERDGCMQQRSGDIVFDLGRGDGDIGLGMEDYLASDVVEMG